jgi:hypothetical protein
MGNKQPEQAWVNDHSAIQGGSLFLIQFTGWNKLVQRFHWIMVPIRVDQLSTLIRASSLSNRKLILGKAM